MFQLKLIGPEHFGEKVPGEPLIQFTKDVVC